MNVVILRGTLSRPAERRLLVSGEEVLTFEVATHEASGPVSTVPVRWTSAPATAPTDEGREVVVVGAVRRRFFRAGGVTQSRTEVVAEAVVAASVQRKVARLVAEVVARAGA